MPPGELSERTHRKTGDPAVLALEAAKTESAAALGEALRSFVVPRVVRFDQKNGILETQFIPGLKQLIDLALRNEDGRLGAFEQAGRALALVHAQFQLSEQWKVPTPPEYLAEPEDNVFLHGDFSVQNVCYDKVKKLVVITDWSGAPDVGRGFTFGPRQFDLVWFSFFLFYSVPANRLFSWEASALVSAMLRGYHETGPKLDWRKFQRYCRQIRPLLRQSQIEKITTGAWSRRLFHCISQTLVSWRWQSYIAPEMPGFLSHSPE